MAEKAENVMLAIGTSFGLAQIETLLGIIFLVVQLTIVIIKIVCKVIDAFKTKNLKTIITALNEAEQEIKEVEDKAHGRKDSE